MVQCAASLPSLPASTDPVQGFLKECCKQGKMDPGFRRDDEHENHAPAPMDGDLTSPAVEKRPVTTFANPLNGILLLGSCIGHARQSSASAR